MADVEMIIDSIRVSLMNYQRVVILKEKEGERYLPIWIGTAEADSIAVKLQGVSVCRPLTHDFTCSIIDALGGSIMCAVINKLENDTFFAKTRLECDGKITEIDCRPSDAIALAVREDVAIFVNEKVLEKAGILLDPETGKPVGEEVVPKKPDQIEIGGLEKFSTPVREIFARAEEQARQLNSKYIGTGHLLLALVEKAPNTASNILGSLGINLTELMSAVKLSVDEEQASDLNKLALNDNAKETIQSGIEEARCLASQQVLSEHLLIAMIQEDGGIAGKILRAHGVGVNQVHVELIRLYGQGSSSQQTQGNVLNQAFVSWEPEMETLKPHRCPRCKKSTLFWNGSTQLFECHNRKCKQRLTAEEFRSMNADL